MTDRTLSRIFGTKRITVCALCTTLMVICSWISIPLLIPFTLQTFAVCLISSLFGYATAVMSLVLYMLLGIFGLPVFSGFRAGVSVLAGPTGGYIIGFFATALCAGYFPERYGRTGAVLILSMSAGVILCYAFGTAWFVWVYMRSAAPVSFASALSMCVVPYIPADAAKIVLSSMLVRRIYPLIGRRKI